MRASRGLTVLVAGVLGLAMLTAACGAEAEPAPAPRSLGVTTATPSGERTPTPSPVPVDPRLSDWAAALCTATADFDEEIEAVQDGVDPSTLTLEERQQRGERRAVAYIDALAEGRRVVEAIPTVAGTEAYHNAVRAQFILLADAFEAQRPVIASATTHEEVEASNLELRQVVEFIEFQVRQSASTLPPAAVTALQRQPRCGVIVG